MKLHRRVEGKIKTVTVKRDVDRWYVCFSVAREAATMPAVFTEIGVDVGLDSFVTLADGTAIDNPRHLAQGLARMWRTQRRLSRRKRGSQRRRKAAVLVAKAHRKIRNQRAACHHHVSRWLNRYGLIAIENLHIAGLSRGMLARSVNDAGWRSFFQKLSYKAACAGRELVTVDPRGTSQTCVCGASVPKSLGDRWHACPACSLSAPRDVVSAQIILQRARIRRSGQNVEEDVSCVSREAVAFQETE